MNYLYDLDWQQVLENYNNRINAHTKLLKFYENNKQKEFLQLALGISDSAGNYSASEHNIGPKIIEANINAVGRVFELAGIFRGLKSGRKVPEIIKLENLSYLKIGVGSEISCMMNPDICWVANSRTIWMHLVIKHDGNFSHANEELSLYRDGETNSEMAYSIWSNIHRDLEKSMTKLGVQGRDIARERGVEPGDKLFLWADAISTCLYAHMSK
jgi:Ethanolamine utilization protein EutJ (predicted chaperonin)